MAIYHFRVKCGKKALSHLEYIKREDKYKYKNDFVVEKSFNLPDTFKDIENFWSSAILYERKNANIYREFEIALPKEFSNEKNKEILEKYLEKIFNKNYVYNYSIHNPKGEQPHAHVMFCDRKLDGINRNKENFFKRYNNKNPEIGGAKKDRELKSKDKLLEYRKSWEEHLNLYLEAVGLERISSETLKNQRNKAIENNEFYKAEKLNREAISWGSKWGSRKNFYDVLKIEKIEKLTKDKELRERIDRIYLEKIFNKKIRDMKKKYNEKSFEEILTEKEKIETEIFKLSKNMKDKYLESKAYDILSNGEINKLKNEKRHLYKKYKNSEDASVDRKYFSNEIEKINKKIEGLKLENFEKLGDKKLELKGKYMKVFKYKIMDKKVMDEIFKDALKDMNTLTDEQKELYRIYIKNVDLRSEKLEKIDRIEDNKKRIKFEVKNRNYSDLTVLKMRNKFLKSNVETLDRILKKYDRSNAVDNKIREYGEFILKDYEYINRDEEYEIGLWR